MLDVALPAGLDLGVVDKQGPKLLACLDIDRRYRAALFGKARKVAGKDLRQIRDQSDRFGSSADASGSKAFIPSRLGTI